MACTTDQDCIDAGAEGPCQDAPDGAYKGECTVGTPAYAPDLPWLDLDGTGDTFLNTNDVSNIQDTCGDIDDDHNPLFPSMTITAQCIAGPDGDLSLPACTSWKQPGDNDLCTNPLPETNAENPAIPVGFSSSGVPPGAPSKCRCEPGFTVPIRVPAFITVDKVTVDNDNNPLPGDPTLFDFSITGPDSDLSDDFSLKDADPIHTSPPLDTKDENGDPVGPYQVTETEDPGWELVSVSYTRDNATPNDTSDDVTFDYTNGGDIQPKGGEVIACTFTNKLLKTTPTVTTDIHDADHNSVLSVLAGTTVHDQATVTGSNGTPTGSVDFTFYDSASDCTGDSVAAGTVPLDESGVAHPSDPFGPLDVGSYSFKAHYNGDLYYFPADSACEPLTVGPRSPSITTQASWTGQTVGNEGTVGDSATFVDAYNPTGSVSFALYDNAACSGDPVVSGSGDISNGSASYSQLWTPPAAGTYYWIASYAGDANNNAFTTSCGDDNEDITVDKRSPSITTQADPTNVVLGQEATVGDTATFVDAYNPTGSVTFSLYDNDQCSGDPILSGSGDISGGSASYSQAWTPTQTGTYYWIASYAGDDNNNGFTTACGDANEMLAVSPPIAVTDSMLCQFGGTFRDILSMDPKLISFYKETATNPGQFYYNLSVSGTPGEIVEVTLSIPWPFVTQGARPVHVYDGVTLEYIEGTDYYCFVPGDEEAAIDKYIVLSNYNVAPYTSGYLDGVSDKYVEVVLEITIPDTGFAYINQHMDYGLKGLDTDFDGNGTADPQHYVKDANDDALLPDYDSPGYAADPPVVLIPEGAEHPFCTFEGETELGCDSAFKDNDWKFNPGTAGQVIELVTNQAGDGIDEVFIEGAFVELIDRKGNVVGQDYSDQDGWYQIVYKHIGRPSNYTFRAILPNGDVFERVVRLKGNEFEEVNVYVDHTTPMTGSYVDIGGYMSSSKVTKTWKATLTLIIEDDDSNPVANAQVSGYWNTDPTEPILCISDLEGECTVALTKLPLTIDSVTFTVIDIAADGLLYDAPEPPPEFTVYQLP